MKIDKTFVINLKERKDRRDNIERELTRVNIKEYEFFDAIRPTLDDLNKWNPEYLKTIPKWFKRLNKDDNKYRLGCLGCLLSHYNIIKIAKERNYKNILILEDDTFFTFDKSTTFQDIMSDLSIEINKIFNNYGILYLTGNHANNSLKRISNNIVNTRYTLTTGSYLISERAMDFILDNLYGYAREIDVFYVERIQQTIPCYCIYPHIAGQSESYSDIAQINVNYRL